ncbi:MAG TPA: class I SAM-dependent methyltransferase [Pyrinomonadaceae bacterium]|nr:class I SAM-dependent methyltransferase [Pyrinomonadaceae bacterium]
MSNFEQLISRLDLKIYEKIKTQLTDNDKQTLLGCQFAVRNLLPKYNYLEIGSYLGGSIQSHLLDEKCARVYSIDKRPLRQPDERGVDYIYLNNSTARMLELLSEIALTDKIKTIDGDTRHEVKPSQIEEKIQMCFIDGEHTDEAVLSDFKFCLEVLDENGAILFHDSAINYNAIANCVQYLKDNGIEFRANSLPDAVFVVEIGDFPLHKSPPIMERLLNNHVGFIFQMQYNDYYRQFINKKPFQLYRRLMTKLKGTNISD